MSDNAFTDAMDAQDTDDESEEDENDFDDVSQAFLDRMGDTDRTKNETVGIAVNEEMKAVWSQLRRPSDEGGIDTDVAQSVRNHIEKLAYRHQDATERAVKKFEIDRD